jgi:hypothetical protein
MVSASISQVGAAALGIAARGRECEPSGAESLRGLLHYALQGRVVDVLCEFNSHRQRWLMTEAV